MILQKLVNFIPWRLRGMIRNIPGLKQLQRQIVKKYLEGVPFIHRINAGPAKGLVYPIVLPDDKLIWIGNYEQEFSETLAAAVTPGGVCYDIGGYRGFFSGVMACQGAALVHVFEPLPSNIEQIRKMTALNPNLPITIHEVALADVTGETTFTVMPEASMGKLGQSEFESGDCPDGEIKVRLDTLDSMLGEGRIAPAQLLKIDVEGAEVMVLQGAAKFISEHRPIFYIEAHSHELARGCVNFLKPHGYTFRVMETGREPDFASEPEVCHLNATPI